VAIGKVLLQLMDARTFVRNHDGIKTGYTKHVLIIAFALAVSTDMLGVNFTFRVTHPKSIDAMTTPSRAIV
jgi:hypothetical protein